MGGKSSKRKGYRGEKEVIDLLQPIVNDVCGLGTEVVLERNLMQARKGGCDMVGLDWISLEVKRQEKVQVSVWWKQTLRQCKDGQTPVLLYRENHAPWKCRMRVRLELGGGKQLLATVDIDIATFLLYFRHRTKHELGQ
jgi:hypothetical protein